jgi:protein-tyrosine phosphatase
MTTTEKPIGVLFVCLGNICRSPSAEGVFRDLVSRKGLAQHFNIDSCGTAPFNVGKSPDPRAIHATTEKGYDIRHLIARQIDDADYENFDFIIPMDRKNKMSVDAWRPSHFQGETELFMHYHPNNLGSTQIPDPYHDGPEAFLPIIEVIEQASEGLLEYIIAKHKIAP